jgi:multidrug efflux pump subunit AcrA (membrane-fusion protein)
MSQQSSPDLFRPAALEYHARGEAEGDVIRFEVKWSQWAYVLAVFAALVSLIFCCFFSVNEYATGVGVVRVDGKRMVTATSAGSIEAFDVNPGEYVEACDILVRLHDAEEQAELKRATTEFNNQLMRLLLNAGDATAKAALTQLKATRDRAAARVDERLVRAPAAGYVSDVRIRAGQHVAQGDVLFGIAPKDASVYVLAVVPGDFRPMLQGGQQVRFALSGYPYEYQSLKVDTVGETVIGPTEVQKFLGQELFDAVHMGTGAKVLVTAKLPTRTFTSEGQEYAFFDGLNGTTEIRVRSEPLIVTLIPALKTVFTK